MARARTTGTATVELEGIFETLKAFQGLERDMRSEANAELRAAARTCATVLAGHLARSAAASGVPVAPRVARSIRVKSDRIPVITIGGTAKVGRTGAQAGKLVWGSEQGPKGDVNHWAVPPSPGYWIAPAVRAFQGDQSIEIYKRAIVDLERKHGLL
jgi:hypothetical protein